MAALDVDAAIRWLRPGSRGRLHRRSDAELPFSLDRSGGFQGVLLDTCVYIDQLRGRLPEPVAQFIATRHLHHSTVAVQELMFGMGALDPSDPRFKRTLLTLKDFLGAMRPHRTFVPDTDLLGRAAMMAGMLARIQTYSTDGRMRALMDATLFLQGHKLGLLTVTRNIGDFDLLLQLVPDARVLMYRTDERSS